jgi:hypothetical protein
MARLEDITRGASIKGILPDALVTVIDVKWIGTVAIELTYKDPAGQLGHELLYREREPTLEVATAGQPWSFDGDGALFRLVSEANRIRLAHLFDPLLAVHTSLVDPLPHQITAVYGEMLLRQPLRFLKRGAILVDENDSSEDPRALVYVEHAIQDARIDRSGKRRVVSKRMQFVELTAEGTARSAGPAPYLDYRPAGENELAALKSHSLPPWLRSGIEARVLEHAIEHLVPGHLDEVRRHKEELVDKTLVAVKDRLTKEINYWDHRAAQLKDQELAGKVNARLNSGLARQRADDLTTRLQKRLAELEQERKLSPLPPNVTGGCLVIPFGLLCRLGAASINDTPTATAIETEHSERLAMDAVMDAERNLGNVPKDVSAEKLGYDIESAVPGSGRLRFIEVKGRVNGAATVTITKNEVLTALNKPDDFVLAIAVIDGESVDLRYVRRPFEREPDFGVTSLNYALRDLLSRATIPV